MTVEGHTRWREEGGLASDWSYMKEYSPMGSLGTRDVVARATDAELKMSGESHVLLVTEHLDMDSLRGFIPDNMRASH